MSDALNINLTIWKSAFNEDGTSNLETLSFQEAIDLQQKAHAQDLERQQQIAERKKRLGLLREGEILTRQEREARIWAYM
jgi:hypothetical protein